MASSDASCVYPRCARARSAAGGRTHTVRFAAAAAAVPRATLPRPLTFDMPVCFSLHLSPFLPRLPPSFLFCGGDLSLSCAQRDKFREALSAYLNCLDAFTAARKWEKSDAVGGLYPFRTQAMRFLLFLLLWRTLAWPLLPCGSPSAPSVKTSVRVCVKKDERVVPEHIHVCAHKHMRGEEASLSTPPFPSRTCIPTPRARERRPYDVIHDNEKQVKETSPKP